jgi:hypothetical protein
MAPGLVRANKFLAGKARFEQRKLSAIPSCHHLRLQRSNFTRNQIWTVMN